MGRSFRYLWELLHSIFDLRHLDVEDAVIVYSADFVADFYDGKDVFDAGGFVQTFFGHDVDGRPGIVGSVITEIVTSLVIKKQSCGTRKSPTFSVGPYAGLLV